LGPRHCFHDERERRRWQNPEAILRDVGLRSNLTFVDLGCGDGFFALPAARLVGKKGRVYAIDEDYYAIDRLNKKAAVEGLGNLETRVGEAERVVLCKGCADIVFFGIVLHDFNDPLKVLMNAKKMLKATGRLIDLDWKKEPMEVGPPLDIRFDEDEAVRLIESVGLKIDAVKESGPFHYMIIAKP
jgi:ubiquinone/menaquinone biosynthesis C-methylase UbiE